MASAFAGPLSQFYGQPGDDMERLVVGIETWRADLIGSVGQKVGDQLDWDERNGDAMRCELGASGWLALQLFAFYAERTDLEMPDTVPPLLELDNAWRAAKDEKFARSLYGQILACSCWLPGDFPVTFRVPMPDGDSAEIGSTRVLSDQLKWLNERTFAADATEVARWQSLPAEPSGDLLDAARRGYAGLWVAVQSAIDAKVPLVVREVK